MNTRFPIINKIFMGLIGLALVIALAGTLVGTNVIYWTILIVVVAMLLGLAGAAIYVTKLPAQTAKDLVDRVSSNPLLKGIFVLLLLLLGFSVCLYVLFGAVPGWIQGTMGVEWRWAMVLMVILGLPLIPLVWLLFGPTGIPGDPKVIGKAFRGVAFLMLIFFAWWYHDQPNRLFDVDTGQPTFWVADKEGKIYYFPGPVDTTRKYFSPVTGERLRPGEPTDVPKYRKESWTQDVKKALPSISIPTPVREENKWMRFYLRKGEVIPTVYVSGKWNTREYIVESTGPFKVHGVQPDGTVKIFTAEAGRSRWTWNGAPGVYMEVEGLEDGTEVSFKNVL